MIKCPRCEKSTHVEFILVHGVCEFCGLKTGTIYYDGIIFDTYRECYTYISECYKNEEKNK